MKKYVIIGAGAAGVSCANEILKRDTSGQITILCHEYPPMFYRPLLPYILTGQLTEDNAILKKDIFEDPSRVNLLTNHQVNTIDTEKNLIFVNKNEYSLNYDKLLIATGASPLIPSISGIDAAGVFGFNNLKDSSNILNYFKKSGKDNHCVVIGGGFIGLSAALALHKIGVKVSMVELLPTILSTMLDNTGSELIKSMLVKSNFNVFTKTKVNEILRDKKGAVRAVRLNNKETLDCSMVIVAAGIKPEINTFKNIGISTGHGILANSALQTNIEHIYAAGDVAETFDRIRGKYYYSPNWINARNQGLTAGANMAGASEIYDGSITMNSLVLKEIPVISMGIINPDDHSYKIFSVEKEQAYKKILVKDGKIKGAILIKNIERAGTINRLMKENIDISGLEEKVLKDSEEFIHLILSMRKKDMEGDVVWPAYIGMTKKYKKKIDPNKWEKRKE